MNRARKVKALAKGILDGMTRRLSPISTGWRWETVLCLLVLFILAYSWMYGEISVPNERTRVYLSVAIVDHHQFTIDEPVKRFGPTNDWARRDGHYYTDKAPGSSILGVAAYGVARLFTDKDDWTIVELVNLMRTWIMLPIGLLGFLLVRRLLQSLDLDESVVDVCSLAWILGTSAFHYSTAFYGHQIVAVSILGALLLARRAEFVLDRERESEDGSKGWTAAVSLFGAGFLAGLAGATEYQSAIPCMLLAAYVLLGPVHKHIVGLCCFAAGAIPWVVFLLCYNYYAFGGPFELSYNYLVAEELRAIHGQGIGGVEFPKWEYAKGAFTSLHRGLLATSPIMVLALPGLFLMWRRRLRRLTVLVALAMFYYALMISSTEVWFAGWSFGPRLLVPVMAWAMIPVAVAFQFMRRSFDFDGFGRGLAVAGICYHQIVHAVFPELPETATNPIVDVVSPSLRAGQVSPNLGTKLMGWNGLQSVRPLFWMVTLAVAIVLFRGMRTWPSTRERRSVFLVALGAVLPIALYALYVPPGWDPARVHKFVDWLARLEAR